MIWHFCVFHVKCTWLLWCRTEAKLISALMNDTMWINMALAKTIAIPHSGKLSQIVEKYEFRSRENFRRLLAFAAPKDTTPQISWRKRLWIATKLRNSWKFSPSKVSRYTVWSSKLHCLVTFWLSWCSYCGCPGLQCGYEAGLSWRDGDYHLHCHTGVCSGVGCWAISSIQFSYPVKKYWYHYD